MNLGSLKGLDPSYRRIDTAKERAELSARLYCFVVESEGSVAQIPSGIHLVNPAW